MLKKIADFFKNKELVQDTINIILGLLMLTALVVFWKTGSTVSMFLIIFCGGAMNLSSGFRFMKQKGRKPLGQSMLLLGIVVVVLGIVLLLA